MADLMHREAARRVPPAHTRRSERWTPRWAHELTELLLQNLPARLAHSIQAGTQARRLRDAVPADEADLLETAAVLHDIGYSPLLQRTGFHPVDGALFLLETGAPHRLAALVAHHSEAWLLARASGLTSYLARFPHERSALSDALTCADMTAGPCGTVMTVPDRLADIAARHSSETPALRAARKAREPLIRAAVQRVAERAAEAG